MIFGDGDESDEEGEIHFFCTSRRPISADALTTAALVERIEVPFINLTDRDPSTALLFASTYRSRKPVILSTKGAWSSLPSTWDDLLQVAPAITTATKDEVEVLIAKDNRNFLKNELCNVEMKHLQEAWREISESDKAKETEEQKRYCRLYLDQYPALKKHFDLQLLHECASASSHIDGGAAKDFEFNDKNIGFWASSAECVTPLHFDLCHGFLGQVIGKKHFLLCPPEDATTCLYWRDDRLGISRLNQGKNATTCPVDMKLWLEGDVVERKKYPRVEDAAFFSASLEPGDILYTPPGWLHVVTSVTASASLLVPFDPVEGDPVPQNIIKL